MNSLKLTCPACAHEVESAETELGAVKCPRCGEWIRNERGEARIAEGNKQFIERAAWALLLIGLIVLAWRWWMGDEQGIIGGGFFAVIGAILTLRK